MKKGVLILLVLALLGCEKTNDHHFFDYTSAFYNGYKQVNNNGHKQMITSNDYWEYMIIDKDGRFIQYCFQWDEDQLSELSLTLVNEDDTSSFYYASSESPALSKVGNDYEALRYGLDDLWPKDMTIDYDRSTHQNDTYIVYYDDSILEYHLVNEKLVSCIYTSKEDVYDYVFDDQDIDFEYEIQKAREMIDKDIYTVWEHVKK